MYMGCPSGPCMESITWAWSSLYSIKCPLRKNVLHLFQAQRQAGTSHYQTEYHLFSLAAHILDLNATILKPSWCSCYRDLVTGCITYHKWFKGRAKERAQFLIMFLAFWSACAAVHPNATASLNYAPHGLLFHIHFEWKSANYCKF